MSYCIYEVDKEKRIARLTFNRPEKINAFTHKDMDEITDRLLEVDRDDNVAVVILKGAGGNFGSGRDIDEVRNERGFDEAARPSQRRRYWGVDDWWGRRAVLQKVLTCDKVTLAQVDGYCYGGSFEIMCACDLAVASENSIYTHPGYTYLGIEGPIPLYVLTIGWRRVKEMMLLGRPLNAQKAMEWGLVNRVVPNDKLEEEVNQMAELIAGRPIDGIVMGKKEFQLAMDAMGLSAGYDIASIAHTLMSNQKFEPGEFNLMKELRDRGRKGMYAARDAHYKGAQMKQK